LLLVVAAEDVETFVLEVTEDIGALTVVETDVFERPPLQPAITSVTTSNMDTKTITFFILSPLFFIYCIQIMSRE
jgi:hypothetical protein